MDRHVPAVRAESHRQACGPAFNHALLEHHRNSHVEAFTTNLIIGHDNGVSVPKQAG